MRTNGRSLRMILLAISTLSLLASNPTAASQQTQTSRKTISLNPVSVKVNSLSIAVDPRMELLSIVQYLSSYGKTHPGLVTRNEYAYRKDVDQWFSRYKGHAVIKMFDNMSSKGFSYDAPPTAVLYLNADLSINKGLLKNAYLLKRAGGNEQMVRFADAMRAFAVASGFAKFYNNHIPFYTQIAEETSRNVENTDAIKVLEEYYGEKKSSYTVVISPLFGKHSYGPQIELTKGNKEVYCIMGPSQDHDGIPTFSSTGFFHQLQWHEFGHSFVNPLSDEHTTLLNKYSNLYSPLEEKMTRIAYGNWSTVVDESIIRAVTTRLAYRLDGSDAGDKELYAHKSGGFVFTSALVKKLEEYEQNRTTYPTFASFYPELMKTFDEFSPTSVKDLLDSIVPTVNQEIQRAQLLVYELPDDESQADAVEYVGAVHDRFFSKLKMIDAATLDDSALKDNLKGDFALYTTIDQKSKLFNAATQRLGIQIDGGTFKWNTVTAPADDLRLILVAKNPYGDGNCVIYAARTNELLVGINSCFHGPCSYHIFQGDKLLKEDFYDTSSNQSSNAQADKAK